MTFNLKTPAASVEAVSAKDIRQAAVEQAFMHVAQGLHDGTYTREASIKALVPVMDSLHTGPRVKGHAEMMKGLVQDNLDSALDAIGSQGAITGGMSDDKPACGGQANGKGKGQHKAA